MHHLPAYLALQRFVSGRRVAVIMPDGAEGPRMLKAAGARQVLVIGSDMAPEKGIEVGPGGPDLPLVDESVDLVVCIEGFGALPSSERRELTREAQRVLRPHGLFVAWIEQADARVFGRRLPGSPNVDFWTLEDDLAAQFEHVDMIAQMPWQGFSLAPIFDDPDPRANAEPLLSLRQDLLRDPPEASHFLAFASKSHQAPPLTNECVLLPLPAQVVFGDADDEARVAEVEELSDELERLREDLSLRAARAAAAHARVRELEEQLQGVRARADEHATSEVAEMRALVTEFEIRLEAARSREGELELEVEQLRRERSESDAKAADEQARLEVDRGQFVADRRSLERLQVAVEQAEAALVRADEMRAEHENRLSRQEMDLGVLTRVANEREVALARACAELEEVRNSRETLRRTVDEVGARIASVEGERDELRRQVDVLLAEREGARKLAARVEAELELAKRKLDEQDGQYASKLEEASRVAGEMEALRQRSFEQERRLAQFQSRTEELSASAASGAEKGRMLADVALDRDRLREELGSRARQIEELERRSWDLRDALQSERIENVRFAGEHERQREQLDRSRAAEQERVLETAALARQLRDSEQARSELAALLRARDERISQMTSQAEAIADESADVVVLRRELEGRGAELARVVEELEQTRARGRQATDLAARRERELHDFGESMRRMQATLDDQAALSGELQVELDARQLEVEQLVGTVTDLHAQIEAGREALRDADAARADVQRRFEEAAYGRQDLRRRLRICEQELEQFVSRRETDSLELFKLRRELDATVHANEELEQALQAGSVGDAFTDPEASGSWPADAQVEVAHLRERLTAQAKRYDEQLAAYRARVGGGANGEAGRLRSIQLEVAVRAAEQEQMLAQLDGAEQRIWEMTDAADRNAARFAASLAQLEKQREKVDQVLDELEVTRNLLIAEQTRAVEQERLLASERAKLARAGLGSEGFPRPRGEGVGDVDRVFAELATDHGGRRVHGGLTALGADGIPGAITDGGSAPHSLRARVEPFALDAELARLAPSDAPQPSAPEPGTPASTIHDRSPGEGSGAWRDDLSGAIRRAANRAPGKARLVVEEANDDEPWPDEEDERSSKDP